MACGHEVHLCGPGHGTINTDKTVGGATTAYAYDAANRLKAVTSGATTTATYTYDGDGYRVGKTVGATTTTYAWDRLGAGGLGTVVGDGAAEYVFGPAGLQQRTVGSASQYAQGDGLGSVRLVTDRSGVTAGTATFEPWGAPKAGSASLGGFGFTGEQTDAETGFVYLRARNYDPASGRFLQQDGYLGRTVNPTSLNLFAYVQGNPIKMVDPSGHAEVLGGGNLNNTRQECIAVGYLADFCASASPEELAAVMADTGGTLIDPTDPVSAWRDGSPIDKAICGLFNLWGVGGIIRGGERWIIRGLTTRQAVREAVAGLTIPEAQAAKILEL